MTTGWRTSQLHDGLWWCCCECSRCSYTDCPARNAEPALAKAGGHPVVRSSDEGVLLTETQAEAVSTALQVYASLYARLQHVYDGLDDISDEEMTALKEAGEYAITHSLDRLSDSAKERLTPVMATLRSDLVEAATMKESPSALWQSSMEKFLGDTYWTNPEGSVAYTPYEFHRLARTEAAFVKSEIDRSFLEDKFDASTEAVDAVGAQTPLHPNCNCLEDVHEGSDNKNYVAIWPSASACEFCLDIIEEVLAHIP